MKSKQKKDSPFRNHFKKRRPKVIHPGYSREEVKIAVNDYLSSSGQITKIETDSIKGSSPITLVYEDEVSDFLLDY